MASTGRKERDAAVWETKEGIILSSGFHRVAAYEAAGVAEIRCIVFTGSKRDATWHALGENHKHGLRRTNADKRRAVELALADKEWRKWSDRKIAEHCGVHHQLVARIRIELDESSSCQPPTRIGADGKERRLPVRPMPEPAEDPLPEEAYTCVSDADEPIAIPTFSEPTVYEKVTKTIHDLIHKTLPQMTDTDKVIIASDLEQMIELLKD